MLGSLVTLAAALFATAVAADPLAPVVVEQRGPGRVRVQLSEGRTMPCDSRDDRMLFDSWLEPGQTLRGAIGGDCVCVRHTFDNFSSVNWSPSGLACRPRRCRARRCVPAEDPTIRITIASTDGNGS